MKDLKVIQSAFDEFVNAWFKLSEVLDNIQNDMDLPFLSFSEDAPFPMSFDEMAYEVINWKDTQMEIIERTIKNETEATEKG